METIHKRTSGNEDKMLKTCYSEILSSAQTNAVNHIFASGSSAFDAHGFPRNSFKIKETPNTK